MELMDNLYQGCTMKTRLTRQHFLLLTVKLVERKKNNIKKQTRLSKTLEFTR